jgi:hypothetical protein
MSWSQDKVEEIPAVLPVTMTLRNQNSPMLLTPQSNPVVLNRKVYLKIKLQYRNSKQKNAFA